MRDEIYCGGLISEDYLEHYGRAHDENPPGRGSGRYAYGSGKQPHQNHDDDPKPKKHRSSVVSKKASRKHSENESEEDKKKNSAKESQLKAAREKGEYDLDFMEVISNDSVFEDNNEKEMLKEYSKYLDDPDKWMQTFDSTDYHKKKVAEYKKNNSEKGSKTDSSSDKENSKSNTEERNAQKQKSYDEAKNEGKYDIDFMEVISNDSVFEDNNEKEMLKEYSKYLDDPDKWMRTFDSTDYHKKKVAKYKASHSDVSDEVLSHSSGSLFFKKNERSVDRHLAKRPLSRKR